MKLRLSLVKPTSTKATNRESSHGKGTRKHKSKADGDVSESESDQSISSVTEAERMFVDLEDILGELLMRPSAFRVELEDTLRSTDLIMLYYCSGHDKDQMRLEALMRFEKSLQSTKTSVSTDGDSNQTLSGRSQTAGIKRRRLQVIVCPPPKVLACATKRNEFYRQACRNYNLRSNWLIAIRCRHHISKYIMSLHPHRQQTHGHLVVVKAITGQVVSLGGMHRILERTNDSEVSRQIFDEWYNA